MTKNLIYLFFISVVFISFIYAGNAYAAPGIGGGGGFTDFQSAVETVRGWVNLLIPILIGLAVFFFIFGLLKYVTAGADEAKLKEARNFIIFGIIGIAIMISVWGLVNLVAGTFFPNGGLIIPQIQG